MDMLNSQDQKTDFLFFQDADSPEIFCLSINRGTNLDELLTNNLLPIPEQLIFQRQFEQADDLTSFKNELFGKVNKDFYTLYMVISGTSYRIFKWQIKTRFLLQEYMMDQEITFNPKVNGIQVKPYYQSIGEDSRYFFVANAFSENTLYKFDTHDLVVSNFGKFPIYHRNNMVLTHHLNQWIYLSLNCNDQFSLVYTFGRVDQQDQWDPPKYLDISYFSQRNINLKKCLVVNQHLIFFSEFTQQENQEQVKYNLIMIFQLIIQNDRVTDLKLIQMNKFSEQILLFKNGVYDCFYQEQNQILCMRINAIRQTDRRWCILEIRLNSQNFEKQIENFVVQDTNFNLVPINYQIYDINMPNFQQNRINQNPGIHNEEENQFPDWH